MLRAARERLQHRLAMHVSVAARRLANSRPMISFTFDDAPKSAATTGAAIMEAFDARGTFYVSGSLVSTFSDEWAVLDPKEIVALHRKEHEIGCHTYSHVRAIELDEIAMADEIVRNRKFLQTIDPSIDLMNFAYPYGWGSYARKSQLDVAFRSSRSIVPGINSGLTDLQFLRAVPLIEHKINRAMIENLFDRTIANNGWLIFYTHDVADNPSLYGISPDLLAFAVGAARQRGISICTVAEALTCAGV